MVYYCRYLWGFLCNRELWDQMCYTQVGSYFYFDPSHSFAHIFWHNTVIHFVIYNVLHLIKFHYFRQWTNNYGIWLFFNTNKNKRQWLNKMVTGFTYLQRILFTNELFTGDKAILEKIFTHCNYNFISITPNI